MLSIILSVSWNKKDFLTYKRNFLYSYNRIQICRSYVRALYLCFLIHPKLDSILNVMVHGDAREGKWRRNMWVEWVGSTLHTTSEHGVSSITKADAHSSAASSRLNWRHRRFKWTRPFRAKDEICFLTVCHHISTVLYNRKKHFVCATPNFNCR